VPLDTAGSVQASVAGFAKVRERLRAGEEIESDGSLFEQMEWPKERWGAWEPTSDVIKAFLAIMGWRAIFWFRLGRSWALLSASP
jgi:hypothetical protein